MNNEYTERSLKKHGMKVYIVVKISRGKKTAVKIHTEQKEIIGL